MSVAGIVNHYGHDMWVDIINVGDGACTALENYCSPRGGLTIIDCGTHHHSKVATTPGVVAAVHLGGRLSRLNTMIVTHFDSDHWRGLLELADLYGVRQPAARDIDIFYPGMPDLGTSMTAARVRAGLMAMISTRDDDPINMVRLKKKWSQVSEVRAVPLFRGDVFRANGRCWTVHWPPRIVDVARGARYATKIEELLVLADRMAGDGYPNLRDQWTEAYEAWEEFEDNRDHTQTLSFSEVPLPEPSVEPDDEDDVELGEGEGAPLNEVPEQHREEFRRLLAELQGIDNYFSLVISVQDEFITFGDVEGTALRAVLAESDPLVALKDSYKLMLAPHHGSHQAHATRLPAANLCVSQNGSKHEVTNFRHTGRHRSVNHHLSTWICGTIRGFWL